MPDLRMYLFINVARLRSAMDYGMPSCGCCPATIRAWREAQTEIRRFRLRKSDPSAHPDVYALRNGSETREIANPMAIAGAGPHGGSSRLEGIIGFAMRMGYKKIGVANCVGFGDLAQALCGILESSGFDVLSAAGEHVRVLAEEPWLPGYEEINSAGIEPACNPITQAEFLNACGAEFNVALGLCVGCDCQFFEHAKAPTTVLLVKDRLSQYGSTVAPRLTES